MNKLIFDEETMFNGNIFKYESRIHSNSAKYIENGCILSTFWNVCEDATTVDRGLKDIEQLFGKESPVRFDKIENFPLYGFDPANPNNTDENQVEDINVEGDCTILPSTAVPHQYAIFTLNHLKMKAFFQVVEVIYDSMRIEGFYKIRYRLFSTSEETLSNLEKQTVHRYKCDLNAVGTKLNPIIQIDDFIRREQILKMVSTMITSYRSLFYNDRHNCFLYRDLQTNNRWFDVCANEFMAKHSIMNVGNSHNVIMLHHKINDSQLLYHYRNSVYGWIEIDAPSRYMQKFKFQLVEGMNYIDSSFYQWSEDDIMVMLPTTSTDHDTYTVFDNDQLELFRDADAKGSSEYETLIQKYVNGNINSIHDISLYTADVLLSSLKNIDVYLYTPIIIYIIRKALKMN